MRSGRLQRPRSQTRNDQRVRALWIAISQHSWHDCTQQNPACLLFDCAGPGLD